MAAILKDRDGPMAYVLSRLKARGLTMSWLASELGYTRQYISRWEVVPYPLVPRVSELLDIRQLDRIHPGYTDKLRVDVDAAKKLLARSRPVKTAA